MQKKLLYPPKETEIKNLLNLTNYMIIKLINDYLFYLKLYNELLLLIL